MSLIYLSSLISNPLCLHFLIGPDHWVFARHTCNTMTIGTLSVTIGTFSSNDYIIRISNTYGLDTVKYFTYTALFHIITDMISLVKFTELPQLSWYLYLMFHVSLSSFH